MTSSSFPTKSALISALICVALMLACGGNGFIIKPLTTHIYAAGFVTLNADTIATYWSDGQATVVGARVHPSYATSIAVSDQDIYVAGVEGNGVNDVAKYWKNGKAFALTDGTQRGFAKSIALSGNDIYVAGAEQGSRMVAKYWKNGIPIVLRDLGEGALAQSIFVSGKDVYVAGWMNKTTQTDPTHTLHTQVAVYWKNGVPVELTRGTAPALATSVFVDGNDIYVAGLACENLAPDCGLASYWINGAQVQLTNLTNTGATSIFVSGADVYVSGNEGNSTAQVWKNKLPVQLTLTSSLGSAANQLFVSGSDVFVGGAVLNDSGNGVATYWKNGVPVSLTDGTEFSSAFAISVVVR